MFLQLGWKPHRVEVPEDQTDMVTAAHIWLWKGKINLREPLMMFFHFLSCSEWGRCWELSSCLISYSYSLSIQKEKWHVLRLMLIAVELLYFCIIERGIFEMFISVFLNNCIVLIRSCSINLYELPFGITLFKNFILFYLFKQCDKWNALCSDSRWAVLCAAAVPGGAPWGSQRHHSAEGLGPGWRVGTSARGQSCPAEGAQSQRSYPAALLKPPPVKERHPKNRLGTYLLIRGLDYCPGLKQRLKFISCVVYLEWSFGGKDESWLNYLF